MQPVLTAFVRPRAVRGAAILLSIQLAPALFPSPVTAQLTLQQSGASTPLNDPRANWGQIPIHMALLRGDGAYHSKLMTWQGGAGSSFGQLWGWNQGTLNCSSILGTDFAPLPLAHPGANIFCSGQATLSSGELLINAGYEVNFVGIKQSTIFRPNPAGGQTQWQRRAPTARAAGIRPLSFCPEGTR